LTLPKGDQGHRHGDDQGPDVEGVGLQNPAGALCGGYGGQLDRAEAVVVGDQVPSGPAFQPSPGGKPDQIWPEQYSWGPG